MSSKTESHPSQHPFSTQWDTMLSISAALSTTHNPRGLEACYKGAWISTLRDACAFSNRLCVSTEGYSTVSGAVMRELRLQHTQKKHAQAREVLDIRTRVVNLLAGGTAQSARVTQNEKRDIRHEKYLLEKCERNARAERRALDRERNEFTLAESDVDLSFGNESAHDSAAKDLRPDLYIMHVVGGTIRVPTADDVVDIDPSLRSADQADRDIVLRRLLTQHQARCGIKTVHTCKILIGELKPLPSRREAIQSNITVDMDQNMADDAHPGNSQWADEWYTIFEQSIRQLMDDCVVHFFADPAATKVIGVVSSGPFWHWSEIGRVDTPNYDFLTMEPETDDEKFLGLFPDAPEDCLLLGSKKSDEEINKMRQVIFEMIGPEHADLPTLPTDFKFQLIPDRARDPLLFF